MSMLSSLPSQSSVVSVSVRGVSPGYLVLPRLVGVLLLLVVLVVLPVFGIWHGWDWLGPEERGPGRANIREYH